MRGLSINGHDTDPQGDSACPCVNLQLLEISIRGQLLSHLSGSSVCTIVVFGTFGRRSAAAF